MTKRFLHVFITFILSLVLLFPLSLASNLWHISFLVLGIASIIYFYKYYKTHNILLSFLSGSIFGIFFSISFWLLYHLHSKLHLQYSMYFIVSFFAFFSLTCWGILNIRTNKLKNYLIILFNLGAIGAFVLILLFSNVYETSLGHAILLGFLVGFVVASLSAYIFEFVVSRSTKLFTGLADYVAILLKPFIIFFIGYVSIALLFGGVYNLIYLKIPNSLSIPSGQIGFLDLIIYSLDTMTTGGNSAVVAESSLAQGINTVNVLSAIIWMTVMLAATIAYTSESFSQISKRHKKGKANKEISEIESETIRFI